MHVWGQVAQTRWDMLICSRKCRPLAETHHPKTCFSHDHVLKVTQHRGAWGAVEGAAKSAPDEPVFQPFLPARPALPENWPDAVDPRTDLCDRRFPQQLLSISPGSFRCWGEISTICTCLQNTAIGRKGHEAASCDHRRGPIAPSARNLVEQLPWGAEVSS